jgi:hypothetical protein
MRFNMSKTDCCLAFVFLIISAPGVPGQASVQVHAADGTSDAHQEEVLANTARLRFELTLDRAVYLAGETMSLTVRVSNPTPAVLEVYDPFGRYPAVGVDVMKWGHDDASDSDIYNFVEPHPIATRGVEWIAPAIFINPGQTLEKHVMSYDKECTGCRFPVLQEGGAPTYEGKYRLRYGYAGSGISGTADFSVRYPTFKMAASADLGPSQTRPLYIRAAVLQLDQEQILVLSREGEFGRDLRAASGKPMSREAIRHFAPFDRIEESGDAISIRRLGISSGQITLEWQNGELIKKHEQRLASNFIAN